MIAILFFVIQNALSECVENSFMTFPKSAEWVYVTFYIIRKGSQKNLNQIRRRIHSGLWN